VEIRRHRERDTARDRDKYRDVRYSLFVIRLDAQLGKLVFHISYSWSTLKDQQPSRSTTQNVLINAAGVWNRFRPYLLALCQPKSSSSGSGSKQQQQKNVRCGLYSKALAALAPFVRVRASEMHNGAIRLHKRQKPQARD